MGLVWPLKVKILYLNKLKFKIMSIAFIVGWIFILACIPGLPVFPLVVIAAPGCVEVILNPRKEHWLKNVYIIFIHLAPFLWVPYDLSLTAFMFSALVIAIYLTFMTIIGKHPLRSYHTLLHEHHKTLSQFLDDRFMIRPF